MADVAERVEESGDRVHPGAVVDGADVPAHVAPAQPLYDQGAVVHVMPVPEAAEQHLARPSPPLQLWLLLTNLLLSGFTK